MATPSPDSILHKINKQFVSLDSADKQYVAAHYQRVLEKLITAMKYEDRLFSAIYKDLSYAGSYYDGLKICKPEEFDLNLIIELPIDYKDMTLSNKNVPPGFIKVQAPALRSNQLQQRDIIYKAMQKWTDNEGFLLQSEFLKWMQEVVDRAINSFPKQGNNAKLEIGGEFYQIQHRSNGPAITLRVTLPDEEAFEVDLVPVLEFKHSEHWPPQVRRNPFPDIETWCIVPKKNSKNPKEFHDTFWRLSFNEQEREIINDKGHLKSTCRLVKKLRDRHGLHRICSYYIKTVILWKVQEKSDFDPSYWKTASLSQQFLDVLKSLAKKLTEKRIEYFWNEKFNLLDGSGMNDVEQVNAGRTVRKIISDIERKMPKNPFVFAEELLTADEMATFINESHGESQSPVQGVGLGAIYFQNNDRQSDGTVALQNEQTIRMRESFNNYKVTTSKRLKKLSDEVEELYQRVEQLQGTLARQQNGIRKLFGRTETFENFWPIIIVGMFIFLFVKITNLENHCSSYNSTIISNGTITGMIEDTIVVGEDSIS